MTTESLIRDGELAAKISNTVVRALARTTGRGPTKAKTTLGPNGVFVVLQDTLTRGEQTLAAAGHSETVLDLRHRWQMIMKKDVSREIEELTGRKVIGFMSDNHIDPTERTASSRETGEAPVPASRGGRIREVGVRRVDRRAPARIARRRRAARPRHRPSAAAV